MGRQVIDLVIKEEEQKMKTVVDLVIEYVQKAGEVTVKEMSSDLALSAKQAERIASMLEESGLVSIRYSLLNPGKTIIVSNMGKGKVKETEGGNRLKDCVNEIVCDMRENEKLLQETEAVILERLRKVENLVNRVNTSSKADKKEMETLEKEMEEINCLKGKLDDTAIDLQRRLQAFGDDLKLKDETKRKHEGIVGKIASLAGKIRRK
ncbi:Uncharacterised protein [Candidatus Gugararchaeum adminiculabundum]|nr:Uncharacterised protein [Candidatus Gugararchaeum adminiculabundum]